MTTFTTVDLLMIISALGVVIVNVIVALRTSGKVDETKRQLVASAAVMAEVSAKADVITGHVNSASTKSAEKIDSLQKQIVLLAQLLADSKTTAAVLAQNTADTVAAKGSGL